jgi:uncharacterized protein (DUF1697 family)
MNYVAFLRGINVGKKNWISMELLKGKFEENGYANVQTYINSGNVIFESNESKKVIKEKIEHMLYEYFSEKVPTLILKKTELNKINEVIPQTWMNDKLHRTDVALLFPEIDKEEIVNELPFIMKYVKVIYTKGALIWNIKREDVIKSRIVKIIGHPIYPFITIRNINTFRYLVGK